MTSWRWRIAYALTFIPLGFITFFLLLCKGIYLRLQCFLAGAERAKNREGDLRVLGLAYMHEDNASARQRLYNYTRFLEGHGVKLEIVPPTRKSVYRRYFVPGKINRHYRYFIFLFISRFFALWSSFKYDAVFLQREILSEFFYDPPLFIFALRLLNKHIIYDVDDSMWLLPPQSVRSRSRLQRALAKRRFYWNVRLSRRIIVSNEHLALHARQINGSVCIIPTLVDMRQYPGRDIKEKTPVIIGWTGGPGNLIYLKLINKALSRLSGKYGIILRVISSRKLNMPGVKIDFIPWNQNTEAGDICSFDVGVMPLPNNEYTKGKGGFKMIEYMAAGIPSVASPVGVNVSLIKESGSGFLAGTEEEWERKLSLLIENAELRHLMGRRGREFVRNRYDYRCWVDTFARVIRDVSLSNESVSN